MLPSRKRKKEGRRKERRKKYERLPIRGQQTFWRSLVSEILLPILGAEFSTKIHDFSVCYRSMSNLELYVVRICCHQILMTQISVWQCSSLTACKNKATRWIQNPRTYSTKWIRYLQHIKKSWRVAENWAPKIGSKISQTKLRRNACCPRVGSFTYFLRLSFLLPSFLRSPLGNTEMRLWRRSSIWWVWNRRSLVRILSGLEFCWIFWKSFTSFKIGTGELTIVIMYSCPYRAFEV